MCFSPGMSFGIGACSFALAAWLARRDGGWLGRKAMMFWYFGLIEFMQLAQYMVADQCSNPVNKALTYAAYIHIAFQPLVVNHYFWGGWAKAKPDLVKFIMRLNWLGAGMMLMRLPGMPLGLIGDYLHKWIPDLPPSSMHGQACHYLEASCAPKLCSVTGGSLGHISWSVPLLPSTYFVPGASIHAFLFFVPTLLAGAGLRRNLMILTLFAGPGLSMWLSTGDKSTYPLEWPTIWCFFAAAQAGCAALFEIAMPAAFEPRDRSASGAAKGSASRTPSPSGALPGKAGRGAGVLDATPLAVHANGRSAAGKRL